MSSLQNIEVKGETTFAPPPATSYRYVIQLKNDKLSIWMEDRTSKKQWYKGSMAKANYVTAANAVTDASSSDYVKCFQDALDPGLDDLSGFRRTLSALEGDALQLEFTMDVQILRSTWVAKFTFALEPVSVERIDVLESKLRDEHDAIERMAGELRDIQAGQAPAFIQLKATRMEKTSSNLCWNKCEFDTFVVTEGNGFVKVTRSGVYSISGVVSCSSNEDDDEVQLMKNSKCIQVNDCGYMKDCDESIPLSYIERLEKDDVLTVACTCETVSTSYLSIVRLGN